MWLYHRKPAIWMVKLGKLCSSVKCRFICRAHKLPLCSQQLLLLWVLFSLSKGQGKENNISSLKNTAFNISYLLLSIKFNLVYGVLMRNDVSGAGSESVKQQRWNTSISHRSYRRVCSVFLPSGFPLAWGTINSTLYTYLICFLCR